MDTFCKMMLQLLLGVSLVVPACTLKLVTSVKDLSQPLTRLVVHKDKLYIGGSNTIYVLNEDLTNNQSANTCNDTVPKCKNLNQVLLVDDYDNKLITCGTGKNGVCELRNLSDITHALKNSTYPLVSSDIKRPVEARITENRKLLLAVTFGEGIHEFQYKTLFKSYRYAVSTRSLTGFSEESILSMNIEQGYVAYYRSVFQTAGYNYLFTNQKQSVNSQDYLSKVVRFCQNEELKSSKDFYTYSDIPISCGSHGENFNLIQTAAFFNTSILGTESDGLFVGAFTKGNNPENPTGDSVICITYLSELDEQLDQATEEYVLDCSKEDTSLRYLASLKPNCQNESDYKRSDFECTTKFDTYKYAIGNTTNYMDSVYQVRRTDGFITSLQVTKLDTHLVLLVGTSEGKLFQMNLRNMSLAKYHMDSVDTAPVKAIHQEDDDTLYVMTTNKIHKYVTTDCSEFTTCQSVMDDQNPLCGWCIFQNSSTRKNLCPEKEWLHSFNKCVKLETDVKGVPVGQYTEQNVTIKANNLPYRQNGNEQYSCRFTVGREMPIIENASILNGGNFSCKVPKVSEHTEATLTLLFNGKIPLASTPFLFYSCSHYQRCGQCVNTTGAKCTWSLGKRGCISSSTGINDKSKCPALDDSRGDHYVPGGASATITLPVSNIGGNLKFQCFAEQLEVPTVTGAISNAKRFQEKIFVKVLYQGTKVELDDDYDNYVTVYNCSGLAAECGLCSALNKTRYNCNWCENTCCHTDSRSPKCPPPGVTDVVPHDGPVDGGTSITLEGKEFGLEADDVQSVLIGTIPCEKIKSEFSLVDNEDFEEKVRRKIVCTTTAATEFPDIKGVPSQVTVTVNGSTSADLKYFTYKKFSVTGIKPLKGPKAGGTVITIEGENLGIGNRKWRVLLGTKLCLQAEVKPYIERNIQSSGVNFTIECVTGNFSDPRSIENLSLKIDKAAGTFTLRPEFEVLPDPEISEIMRKEGFSSGGLPLTVRGKRMTNGNKGTVKLMGECDKMVPEECTIKSEEVMECYFPKLCDELKDELMGQFDKDSVRKKRDTCTGCIDVTIVVKLDGIEKSFEIRYFRDPKIHTFYTDKDVLLYGTDQQQLVLKGEYLNLVATKSDFSVTIGIANCTVIELTDKELRCSPPNDQPAPAPDSTKGLPEVNVQVGNIHVTVGYLEYEKKVELLLIIAGAVAGGLVFIFVLILCIVFMKYRKVGRKARQYEKNLSNMEMEIKRVAREEFLDMHTTMSSVNKNLVEQGFPYHSYQQFACNVMFSVDYLWTEPVVSNGKMTDDERTKASKGMESLELLISNKFFLVSVISTMEKEKRFFIREKSNLAGNLCAVLMGKMDYLNEILKLLMTNLVQESSPKKHKTLFRRCESITEKLLSNWMSLCLYPHIEKHSGSPLYLLYMATQKTMESGPIDAVTGDAKHTLSEEKLLKNWTAQEDGNEDLRFEAKTLTLNVVVDNGEEIFKCKVLDCDTISQVKSKCLNQIYVNYPASQLPVGANDLALEWHEGFGGILKLRDEDNTSKRDGRWFRLNTLAHYNVKDDSNMALIDPHSAEIQQMEDYANLAQIGMDNGCDGSMDSTEPLAPLTAHDQENQHELQHWHLVKKEEESSKQGKSAIAELYLNRLFTTKQSVMEYMRPLFDIILNQDRCPPPTKFLFDFLDELGDRYKVDGDTVHTWKSHSYAIRVWASLMKMPNLLFDVAIPQYMDDNLDIISQVFIESFSLASHKFTKDTPPQKLIFHHEMNDFRDKVKEFYKNVKVNSENADEFRQYMAEVNRFQQQTSFNKVSALYRFYKQLKPYFEDILENLSTSKEASDLQLDRKLEQVIAIMGEGEDEED